MKETSTTSRSNSKTSNFLQKLSDYAAKAKSTGIAISGAIVAVVAIYFTVIDQLEKIEERAIKREKTLLSTLTVEAIKQEIDPLSKSTFHHFRKLDSIERINAELLALDFMNQQDSLAIVFAQHKIQMRKINESLSRLELQVSTKARDPPDQLALIWQFLKKKELQDSTAVQLDNIMDAIREQNLKKIESTKKGDRFNN